MSELIFDGHSFGELFLYGDPSIEILNSTPDLRDVAGKNGSTFVGNRFGNAVVTFTVAVDGGAEERRDAFSKLGAWLAVDEPKPLVLPDTPDRYYMAVPNGSLALNRAMGAEVTQVSFTIVDPVAYGREAVVTVPSGGSVTFNVDGTYKTKPRIQANAVRDSSSLIWGLRLDGGDFVHVNTGSAAAVAVDIDCDERTCIVNGNVSLITLNSDWLELTPGTHTLAMDNGTGAATVTFRERWF